MYTELIDQMIGQVYQKGVASKILQSMDRIRNEFDPVQARRWPTELLQNARDLAYPDRPVRVQIELADDAVYFRHSGKPFSVKDILSIVDQVSSKKPGEGVGPEPGLSPPIPRHAPAVHRLPPGGLGAVPLPGRAQQPVPAAQRTPQRARPWRSSAPRSGERCTSRRGAASCPTAGSGRNRSRESPPAEKKHSPLVKFETAAVLFSSHQQK